MTTTSTDNSTHSTAEHHRPTVSIGVPPGWQRTPRPPDPVVADVHAPRVWSAPLAPRIQVVTSSSVDAGDFVRGLIKVFDSVEVEDQDRFEVGTDEVDYYRIAHRVSEVEAITEVWWRPHERPERHDEWASWAVVATVARTDYPAWCDLLEDVAATAELT